MIWVVFMNKLAASMGGGRLPEVCESSRLVKRVVQGDDLAFAELYRKHANSVYGYLLRCGLSPSTAEDVTQDVFLTVHRRIGSFDVSRPFKPWLFAVVTSRVSNHFRSTPELKAAPFPVASEQTRESLEYRETLRFLADHLAVLPDVQRQAVLLVCVESLSQQDAAESLGIPVNTFKTHLRRARMKLARAFANRLDIIAEEVQQ